MDELVIGDKKYLSSKQAAKVTGYAKDYIGQLCREGRVPARLVGRSWYVLESAIHDHRFGDQKTAQEVQKESLPAESMFSPTWESPRYEAVSGEDPIPAVNRRENAEDVDPQRLQDSWKEWFDRISPDAVGAIAPSAFKENTEEEPKEEEVVEVEREVEEAEEVAVPIHAVYQKPPEELLPRRTAKDSHDTAPEPVITWYGEAKATPKQRKGNTGVVLQMAGGLFALAVAVLAVFGTGYFDEYIISHSQVGMVAGVSLYNR